jgi:hypothetical protein
MAIPASGPLTFSAIQTEFGGTNPIGLNEYYAGGGLVPSGTSGTYGAVPTSGQISVQNFYGTSAVIPAYIEEIFQTWLYTGNGSTQTITNGIDLSTKGGLVWMKARTAGVTDSHGLFDTARGVRNALISDSTTGQIQVGASAGVTNFGTTGFTTVNNGSGGSGWNNTDIPYASWTFRKQPKFFDVVTYTGNGVAGRTVAHNLGSVPGCIMVKSLGAPSLGGADGFWFTYHRGLTTPQSGAVFLNNTDGRNGTGAWNNTLPTATEFTVDDGSYTNISGRQYVAYIFAHDAGGFGLTGTDNVISCGSFTTNGSGVASVTLGYEPQWAIWKRTDSTSAWNMVDNMRGWGVTNGQLLSANTSNAESANNPAPLIPNATGFSVEASANATYIYIAIRRGPMKVPTDATKVFEPATRTGTGANATVTTGIYPVDMAWAFNRNGTLGQSTTDFNRLRGALNVLYTGATAPEFSATDTLTGFDVQNGYRLGSDSSGYGINYSGATFVNYNFRRAPSFFDEVCYTGTATTQNINHNLTVVPELIILKSRSAATGWYVYSAALGNTFHLVLNTTAAKASPSAIWNSTTPTSTVFTLGNTIAANDTGQTYVAYLFSTCAGVSKVGSYTGNGTTQAIACGFTGGARFVLIKRTDSTGDWYVYDTARGMTTLTDPYLLLNSTAAESATLGSVTTTTGGFTVNAAVLAAINTNAASYIFLAIA